MRSAIVLPATLAMMLTLAACVTAPAPAYQPAVANLQALRAGTASIGVDDFAPAAGVNDSRISLRADAISGAGPDGAFSTYLQQALEAELRNAGRLNPSAELRLSGTLTQNRVDAMDFSVGRGWVGARFVLTRGGRVVYDKELVAEHQWDSSFIGALAIPAAMQGYSATVQKLTGLLFTDPAFIEATR